MRAHWDLWGVLLLLICTGVVCIFLTPVTSEDPLFLVVRGCFLVLTMFICARILIRYETDPAVIAIVLAGIVVTWIYVVATPFNVRAHDALAHADYIRFMAKHWTIPPASGWEYHQPPLYYALAAIGYRIGFLRSWPDSITFAWLQQGSFFVSALSLVTSAWIGRLLFGPARRLARILFIAFVASLPGLIMNASRMSNDALIAPLLFLGTALLIQWWKNPNDRTWVLLWLTIAAAFLTKLNGIALVPAAVACMMLRDGQPLSRRFKKCVTGLLLCTALTFWLPVIRFQQSPKDVRNLLSTGTVGANHAMLVNRTVWDFFTFSPAAMIRIPFNHDFEDAYRRSHYAEVLFRSSLFSTRRSFNATWMAPLLVVIALLLLPWMVRGLIECRKEIRKNAPLLIASLCMFGIGIAYTLSFPYAPSQDFRYMPLLGVTAAYFLALGIERSGPVLRSAGAVTLTGFFCAAVFFIVAQF